MEQLKCFAYGNKCRVDYQLRRLLVFSVFPIRKNQKKNHTHSNNCSVRNQLGIDGKKGHRLNEVKSNAAILIMESSCGTCGAEGVFVLADSGHGIDGNNQAQTEIHKQGIRNT